MVKQSSKTAKEDVHPESQPRKKRRIATLYDAVAGRVGYEGFIPKESKTSKHRDLASTSNNALPPEEVLFRRNHAPLRYEEDDIYFRASRDLKPDQQLPDSDLLKVVHAYTSEFYASGSNSVSKARDRSKPKSRGRRQAERAVDGEAAFYSMDETALLALGILLEEVAAEAVAKSDFMEELLEDAG